MKSLFRSLVRRFVAALKPLLARALPDLLMPKYLYHSPMDYSTESYPPNYGASIYVPGEDLPVPPPEVRPGYSPHDDQYYLEWGKRDHDLIVELIKKHGDYRPNMAIFDWGCASGRVLRHFHAEHKHLGWKLFGTDIQSYLVEWIRQNFPPKFNVICGTTVPHLPYKDDSLDVVYGISVLTHTKYLWDFWLTEFKRVLKPGGLCIQTVQCEAAWEFYHKHKNEGWVQDGHPSSMLEKPKMRDDYFFYGDVFISQIFFKEECLKCYYGRIMTVVEFLPPPEPGYQNWIVMRA